MGKRMNSSSIFAFKKENECWTNWYVKNMLWKQKLIKSREGEGAWEMRSSGEAGTEDAIASIPSGFWEAGGVKIMKQCTNLGLTDIGTHCWWECIEMKPEKSPYSSSSNPELGWRPLLMPSIAKPLPSIMPFTLICPPLWAPGWSNSLSSFTWKTVSSF